MNSLKHLVRMAEQIARNYGHMQDTDAAAATADHILRYWDPRMKLRIIKYIADERAAISEVSRSAIETVDKQSLLPTKRPE
ncbi:formate dehydrogenase subunit delta [Parasphingorhabdus cellanae]|uniref:Formate dehydrogenase subunit delta n=1 Tax=Parasphingorhabdus cellanae TaxID=2806553 RepID=A0ABX7T6U9_9SPHN|nr:formate dehydrogenase subunit delta [Parasphingorhabdus cellanae]QTD55842.1 formate dehydrogenase subunit delta [Parasphingorhabdus cellanae]